VHEATARDAPQRVEQAPPAAAAPAAPSGKVEPDDRASAAKPSELRGAQASPERVRARARTIHPLNGGDKECTEMYGTCTPPPDRLCTSSALVLGCGESAELPSTGERLTCACP
jgi:hypothetical protein